MAAESVVEGKSRSFSNQVWAVVAKVIPTLLIALSLFPSSARALRIEKEIQGRLESSLVVMEKAIKDLKAGKPSRDATARLKAMAEDIELAGLVLEDELRSREELLGGLGPKALERHQAMEAAYRNAVSEYLLLVKGLSARSSAAGRLSVMKKLKAILDKVLHKRKRPILGGLPYRDLNYPARKPDASSSIKPAYRGGSREVGPEDLKSTAEAPIDEETAGLAESLGWSPVAIYEFVKNNIETEWYWGCMKGAKETLRQKSGNDCDQAALLVALLRASGFPARYVRGTIRFFPDIEKARNLTGIEEAERIADLLRKSGIPFSTVISGGGIENFEIEHIWVESLIPYSNYRGAVIDGEGKTWLALDTGIKPNGYAYNSPVDILEELDLSTIREEYLKSTGPQTALDFTRKRIEAHLAARPEPAPYEELLRSRSLPPELMNILPASLQFEERLVSHEYTEIPEAMKHKVGFRASRGAINLFNITLDLHSLSNRSVALSFEPETPEDQALINSYGGLDNTPAYLVRLRPVLKVDGERMVVARDGLPMGSEFDLTVEVTSPGGTERTTSTQICGNLTVLGIVAQKAIMPRPMPEEDKNAEQLLFERAMDYINRWSKAEEELSSLMHLTLARPIATLATVGGVIDVTYLLNTPHWYEWKGVFLDAGLRAVTVQPSRAGMEEREKLFMRISALEGSVLEGAIFEDGFKVDSVSTAGLLRVLSEESLVPLTIDKSNISQVLPHLSCEENIKKDITSSVSQGLIVTIPETEITYQDFRGTGYIKENPATGEAGYMLSGMINGGMTAWSADKWPGDYAQRLGSPYSEPPSDDTSSPAVIRKITATDLQSGRVGSPLRKPLQVMVTTRRGKPVSGVDVRFTVIAGGGKFPDGSKSSIARTDSTGIASQALVLGEKTSANPAFSQKPNEAYPRLMGENLVGAAIPSGPSIPRPFTAHGYPEDPDHMRQTHGDGELAPILSFSGFVSVVVEDKFDNPIANLPLTFSVLPAVERSSCENPNADTRDATLVKTGDPCIKNSPSLGECQSESHAITETTSHLGSSVQVILGATPDAEYPIRAEHANLSTTFRHRTHPFGNCDGQSDPDLGFMMSYTYPADQFGNNINVGKAGAALPLKARVWFVAEKEAVRQFTASCDESTISCAKIVGAREYEQAADLESAVAFFDGEPGAESGEGVFTTTHTLAPGLNKIRVDGAASIERQRTVVCPSCETHARVLWGTGSLEMEAYGVDVRISPISVVKVDGNGFVKEGREIRYTIDPPEYKALSAYVLIYRDGEVVSAIPSEVSEEGFATISQGFQFDRAGTYEAEVVLNGGTELEIRSEKAPIVCSFESDGRLSLARTFHLSRFDDSVPGLSGSEYTDSYQIVDFNVTKPSSVSVTLRDSQSMDRAEIVPETNLPAGDHGFVVDYGSIKTELLGSDNSRYFYLLLTIIPTDGSGSEIKTFQGSLSERTDGKMLGQVMVHDVLIQDGSLNLTRQDMELKGRGPDLSFTRAYCNQPSPRDHGIKPLGEGWSHGLDMKLRPLSFEASGPGSVPAWVVGLKGAFFKPSDIPPNGEITLLQVNGTVFKKHNGTWYPDRGHHGTLEETADSFIFTSKDGTRYLYRRLPSTPIIPIATIEDRNGNVLAFSYDEKGRLATVTDAVGRSFTFTHEIPEGAYFERLTKVSGPDGMELRFSYDAHGYLESAGRGERIETYQYAIERDRVGHDYNLVKVTDANGASTGYEYHGPGELPAGLGGFVNALEPHDVVRKVRYPDGEGPDPCEASALFTYDVAEGNRRIVRDPNGNDTTYILNYYGNPERILAPESKVTSMTWSIDEGKDDNVMTSKTDGRGNTTTYEYDPKGNIRLETDPYGRTITTVWNEKFSLPERRTDRNGVTATWHYNEENGNLKWREDGDGKTTSYTYFDTGEVRTMVDPRGNTTSHEYDQWGSPALVASPEEAEEPKKSITTLVYDIRGRKRAVTDPNGFTTEYAYNDLDYPQTITHPPITGYDLPEESTNVETFVHDPMGNLSSETNRNGLTLTYTHTKRSQVRTVSKSTGGQKTFHYDANGNLVHETDWKGAATTHAYNGLNQRTSSTNRMGHTMEMAYDHEGNLTRLTDHEGRITDYEYDQLNRQTDTYQPALPGRDRGHIHNEYYNEADPKTNLKSVTDQEGNTTGYEYNGRYLPTKRTNALGDVFVWEYDDNGNLIRETDEEGNVTEHEYSNRDLRVLTRRFGDTRNIETGFRHDAAGNRTEITDPRGNTTRTEFDEWNRPFRVTDPDNYTVTTEYDGEGNQVRVIDGNGNARKWVRDSQGRITQAVDAEGAMTSYQYDANDNVTWMKEANDTVTTTTHDAEDRPNLTTEATSSGKSRTRGVILRDKAGSPIQVRDYLGNITTTQYNGLNLPQKVCDPAPFNAQCSQTTYYKTGKTESVTNRRGFATSLEYDALNREIKVTDAKGQSIETTYDKVGNIKTVRDKRAIVKESFFDKLYRLARVEKDGITIATNEYDENGNLTAAIDALGNRVEHAYNKRDLLEVTTFPATTSNPFPTTESRTYDGVGNLVTLTNEEDKVTTYTHDRENRETSTEFEGEKTEKTYDKVGNVTSITKPMGNTRVMAHDGFNHLTSVTEDPPGLNLTTRYRYDANGNPTDRYDPRNNHTSFKYDELGRKTEHIQCKSSGNLTTKYTSYDEEGNVTETVDPKGQVFTYEYDELNRKTDANFPSDAPTPFYTMTRIQTVFDPNNNVTSVTEYKKDPNNFTITDATQNQYDNFDRMTQSTRTQAAPDGAPRDLATTYTYDNNGNRTSVETPSGTTTYTYDARNRLDTAAISSGTADELTTTFTYHPDGKKDTITHPNGTSVKHTYHATNRVEAITSTHASPSGETTIISSYAYLYDANGNRTSQTELQNGQTEATTYQYDTLDRLKEFTITSPAEGGTGPNIRSTQYTFDAYNRKTEKVTQNGTLIRSRTYLHDETDWLKRIDEPGKSIVHQYDANGNLTQKSDTTLPSQDTTFTYDSRNQLVQTTRGPPEAKTVLGLNDYNAQGMRTRHRQSDRGDIDITYDGRSPIEEHNAADNTLIAHYHHADRLLALDTGTTQQYYHLDALGSTVNLTDQTGATRVSYQLDPWGHTRAQFGSSVNRHIFTGKEHDENTGLIYFGARFYDPDTARFLTQDPYLGEATTPPSLHRYLYAYSNPTVYVDLYGYESIEYGDNGEVNWVVESDWIGPYNPERSHFQIGEKKDGQILLSQEYGGGLIAHEALKDAASNFWGRRGAGGLILPYDISDLSDADQKALVGSYLEGINIKDETYISAPGHEPHFYTQRSKFGKYDEQYAISTRAGGVLELSQASGEASVAAVLLATPEPTMVTKVGGYALAAHASDLGGNALRKIVTGKDSQALMSQGAQHALEAGGMDERSARHYADLGNIMAGGTGTAGALRVTRMAYEAPVVMDYLAAKRGVQANKLAGDAVRDAIALREAPALTEQVFKTVGGVRRIDVLKLGDELVGIESKVGRTALESRVRQELARDWWLRRQGQVDRIMWEFSPSEVTGRVGPSRQLMEKLNKLDFDIRINGGE